MSKRDWIGGTVNSCRVIATATVCVFGLLASRASGGLGMGDWTKMPASKHVFSMSCKVTACNGDLSSPEGRDKAIAWWKKYGFTKLWLESYRHGESVSAERLIEERDAFRKAGFVVCGMVTPTSLSDPKPGEKNRKFWVTCWSDPKARERVRAECAKAAKIFDTVILDDFLFSCCGDGCARCKADKAARGIADWGEYKRTLLYEVCERDILPAAKSANPKSHFIIKYPCWYRNYAQNGYTPARQAKLFGECWIGTETRDANPEPIQACWIMAWMDKITDGRCGGGWYDALDCGPEKFVEQAYYTILGGARESFVHCYDYLIAKNPGVMYESSDRAHACCAAFVREVEKIHRLADFVQGAERGPFSMGTDGVSTHEFRKGGKQYVIRLNTKGKPVAGLPPHGLEIKGGTIAEAGIQQTTPLNTVTANGKESAPDRPPLYYYDFDCNGSLALVNAWVNSGTGKASWSLKPTGSTVALDAGGALGSSGSFSLNTGTSLWMGDGKTSLGCGTTNGFTISFWLKPVPWAGSWSDFLGFNIGGVDYRLEYMTNHVDFTVFARERTGLFGRLDKCVTQASDGSWNHVALVFGASTNKTDTASVYVGGEKVATLTLEALGELRQLIVGNWVKGKHGEDRFSSPHDTGIDELAVFDCPLTAEQVRWLGRHRPAKAANVSSKPLPDGAATIEKDPSRWEYRHSGEWDANLADFPRLAGETDDSPRFLRAIAAAPNGVLRVPKGEYDIASPIRIANRCSISMHPAAHLVARAKMKYVLFWDGASNYHALSIFNQDGSIYDNLNLFIKGGDIDGNGLASCLAIANAHHFTLADITLHNGLVSGLCVTCETGGHLYELVANNVYCKCTKSGLAGNVGIDCQVSDCHFTDCIVVDYTKGIRSGGGANRFTRCHVWGGTVPPKGMGFREWSDAYALRKRMEGARKWTAEDERAFIAKGVPEMLPGSVAFECIGGANVFDGCYADTAEIGFDVRNGAFIINSGFFNNPRMNLRKSTAIVHRGGRLHVAFGRFCGAAGCEKLYEGSGKNVEWLSNEASGGAGMAADAVRLFGTAK